ncbi:hypothetical protein [Methylophilus aquaticus]|uniref:Uncharacterized protein n=1 Tax=Methylophilus aquaticus TaxID=1971610 RepID=A0ABT9JSF8_9PROT|nr:hypothetical protein [Methylophilus aquaticus]MDP8567488.1 hypothetical protein [Methylophilus aquaticus]
MRLLQHLKSMARQPASIAIRDCAELVTLFARSRWGRYAPVYRLSSQLRGWHACRIANMHGVVASTSVLGVEDFATIKTMIRRAAVPGLDDVLQDQLFFLAVGAIQVQSQTGSTLAWQRFHQAIHLQLDHRKVFRGWSFGLVVSLCAIWLTMSHLQQTQLHKTTPVTEDNTLLANGGTADPVTISLLQLAYSKMKNGTCQLPQAAMLPEAQRQAFILFVTEGKVDVEHVESLREALGYVNCLYPQALMRPQGRDSNGSVTMHGD